MALFWRRCVHKSTDCFRLILLLSVFQTVRSISLDSNGYYDLVVAIHEKTAQDSNEKFLDNLKEGIQDLSDAIHESTHGNFSIRSVDIVLPDHWNIDADALVTTQSYLNADIRIYHEYSVPQAINPTFCGHPGLFIELPYSFFDKRDIGPYGPTGKALLTLWARYRWGIYEEHGYPGDETFPYWWRDWQPWLPPGKDEDGNDIPSPDPGPQLWKLTECSNVELVGEYKTLTGEDCGPKDELYPPNSDCRFFPNITGQKARTSLMSFSYMQSLTDFCDENNHNKFATNRQNLFCQYKSAWEIIRNSKDFKQLQENTTNIRMPINFRLLKKSDKPLLFILSDGVNMPPDEVISAMESRLHDLIDKTELWNMITSVASFPGEQVVDSYDTVYPWNTPWFNKEEFIAAFRSSFGRLDSTHFRDHGAAILQIVNEIKRRNHSPGAVIVLLKFGTEEEQLLKFQMPVYEAEVIASILETNIRVFSLEGEDSLSYSTKYRLKRVTELSGGLHLPIGSDDQIDNVNKIMDDVESALSSGPIPAGKHRLAFKESKIYPLDNAAGSVLIPITVSYANVKAAYFYVYSESYFYALNNGRIVEGPDSNLPGFNLIEEWGKEANHKSQLAEWTATGDPLPGQSEWLCSFSAWVSECPGTVVVIVEVDDSSSEDYHGIEMQVFTSAEDDNNLVDLNTETVASLKGVAFGIYAKLERNGHPISSPDLEVMANVCHYLDGRQLFDYSDNADAVDCHDGGFLLTDNGPWTGAPDLVANDGIFSGTYIPRLDSDGFRGSYHIYVTARLKTASPRAKNGPLPIDQETIRCGSDYQACWSETISQPFFLAQDLSRNIYFQGKSNFTNLRAVKRILDLRVAPPSSTRPGEFDFDLEWTEPGGPDAGGNRDRRADYFQIYYSNDLEQFLNDTWNDKVDGAPLPAVVGRKAKVTITGPLPGERRWYKLRSTMELKDSPTPVWSNIVFVHVDKDYYDRTTTTSTTTTPAPTPPTTRLPTTPKKPTTIPTRTTTVTTTTTKRVITRPTTRASTTVTTTTSRPTTTPFEITTEAPKRWFKSPEAIATFAVFAVLMIAIIGGALTYMKVTNKG